MTRSHILDCVSEVVGEVAAANGAAAVLSGSTRPAADVAGVTSAQLLGSTSDLADLLGLPIPTSENVFVRDGRAATVDEIADRLLELSQTAPTNGTPLPSP